MPAGKFSAQTLEVLVQAITGGPGYSTEEPLGIYRSGSMLEGFFESLGYDFGIGGRSRLPAVSELLMQINYDVEDADGMVKVTSRLVHGPEYVGKEDRLDSMVSHLNTYLVDEGFEIRKVRGRYRVFPTGQPVAAVGDLREMFDALSMEKCQEDFQRALNNVETDPDSAVTSACATLESVAKAILARLGKPRPKDQSITPLIRAVSRALSLSPDQHADQEIKRIFGGLANTAAGVGVLRTRFGSAHGKGEGQESLSRRHARLAVNAAATVALFLVETFNEEHGT